MLGKDEEKGGGSEFFVFFRTLSHEGFNMRVFFAVARSEVSFCVFLGAKS